MQEGVINGEVFDADKAHKIFTMRALGASFHQIAKDQNISVQKAREIVERELERSKSEDASSPESMRMMFHHRFEFHFRKLMAAAYPSQAGGKVDYLAVNALIRLHVLHARVMGYEEPKRFQIDVRQFHAHMHRVLAVVTSMIPEDQAGPILERVTQELEKINMERMVETEASISENPTVYTDIAKGLPSVSESIGAEIKEDEKES